jgi:hypothetical protein
LERKLAAYFGAAATGALISAEAKAIVVSNSTVQPFGVDQAVNIDFNSDGQADYQIDHDRIELPGGAVDFLQIDKNDVTGGSPGEDPLAIPNTFETFPLNGTTANDTWDAGYVVPAGQGDYPDALLEGAEIGSLSNWDFQEGDNAFGSGATIRANRLIDEDDGQVDIQLGGLAPENYYHATNGPNFEGLGEEVRYLGVRMDFQAAGGSNTNLVNYGWIGIKITNEADATGEVVGWGYETEVGVSILAGEVGEGLPGDFNEDGKVDAADYVHWRKLDGAPAGYNEWQANYGAPFGAGAGSSDAGMRAVPEPGSLLLSLVAGVAIVGIFLWRKIRGA